METPFHMATLQSLLQLLASLAEDEMQQQQGGQLAGQCWDAQQVMHQAQYPEVSSGPNICYLPSCHDPLSTYSARTQQEKQSANKDKQHNSPPDPRDLLLQLHSFCNAAAPPTAAAALAHKAASSSMQHVNWMTAKQIASHDARLLQAANNHQEQKSKKQKRKEKKKHGPQPQPQSRQQQQSFALLHHLKLSLETFIQQHMLELER